MMGLIADHLWQSTLCAGIVALCALAFRRRHAELRYWLWLAASVKFLVPFAALVAAGRRVGWHSGVLPPSSDLAMAIDTLGQPFTSADFSIRAVTSTRLTVALPAAGVTSTADAIAIAAAAIWALGCATVLGYWIVQWRRVARLAREAAPIEAGREWRILRRLEGRHAGTRPLAFRSTPAAIEPGVFGIFHPVLLWPCHIGERLTDEQVEAILAHELCHVRRRDNLLGLGQTMAQAVFWFHPLVWWIGARLLHERERACDEDVIRTGRNPRVYAESILKICEWCVESPGACVAGVTGADLKRRIEAIMTMRIAGALSASTRRLLAVVAVAALAAPVLLGLATGTRVDAQAPAPPSADAFEAASVRPNSSGDQNSSMGPRPGGRFVATNVSAGALIRTAYRLQEFQVVGGPKWLDSERFDVNATTGAGRTLTPQPGGPDPALRGMLQSLLAERFKLVVRQETREMPVYALVLARKDGRLGPRLKRFDVDCAAAMAAVARGAAPPASASGTPPCHMQSGPGRLSGAGFELSNFTMALSQSLQRTVTDRTGLTGPYELELSWTPDQLPPEAASAGAPPVNPDGPSIFAAMEEQLGLKLVSEKGPVPVLVIDRVERPRQQP